MPDPDDESLCPTFAVPENGEHKIKKIVTILLYGMLITYYPNTWLIFMAKNLNCGLPGYYCGHRYL